MPSQLSHTGYSSFWYSWNYIFSANFDLANLFLLFTKLKKDSHELISAHQWQKVKREFFSFFKKDLIYLFLERGREGERERNVNVWLPLLRSQLGIRPGTHACALTGCWTCSPLVLRLVLNPLSNTSQGKNVLYLCLIKKKYNCWIQHCWMLIQLNLLPVRSGMGP